MSYDLREDAAFDADDDEPSLHGAPRSSSGWRRPRVRHVPRHRRAFHGFYREHFGLVWSMVRRFGVPAAQHEDAVQEVWLVAYRRLHTLEPDASAKAWLSSITRRVASRLRRTDHRRRRKLAALEVVADAPPRPASGPCDGTDARRLLEGLLAALDDDQRHVLVLAQVHGLTGPEIAQALEIPLNTAYSRLRLARRRVDRFAAELGAERAAVLESLRRDEQPPPRAAARAWLLLAPELGLSLGGAGTAAGTAAGPGLGAGLSGFKAFAIAVGLGVVGLGVARGVVDARARAADEAAVAQTEPGDAVDRSRASRPRREPASEPMQAAGMVAAAASPALEDDARAHADDRSSPRSPASGPAASPRRTASPTQPVSAAAVEPSTLSAEAELLGRAQRALRAGQAATALALLEEHERRFPTGELGDERRGARVRALCELGRGAQARAEARHLQRERPRSPVAAGVADVCS